MPLYPRADLKDPVVGAIHGYLKKRNRRTRLNITLNKEELDFLIKAARAAGFPTATFIRSAALFGASMYMNARKKGKDETQPASPGL